MSAVRTKTEVGSGRQLYAVPEPAEHRSLEHAPNSRPSSPAGAGTFVMAPSSERLTLRDGGVVDVRPLERRDREGLAAAVRRLSAQSRYLRFATPKSELTKRELDYLVDIDHHRHEAMLAVDPDTKYGVAVVRYVEIRGEPDVVEIAATVADEWQGRGLGPALLARLVERARQEGYTKLRASVLATNRRSVRMLLRAGFTPLGRDGQLCEYELALAG